MIEVWRRASQLPAWLKVLLAGRFVSSAGSFASFFMTLYLVQERGLSPGHAGLVVAGYGASVIVGNLIGGWFGDRFGLRRCVLVATAVSAGCLAALPLAPIVVLTVLAGAGGLAGGVNRPLMSALVATSLPAGRRREAIALWRTASNAGVVVGPPLAALISAHAFAAIFFIDAATSLVMLAIVLRWLPADAQPAQTGPVRLSPLWPALRADRVMIAMLSTVLVIDTVYRLMYTVLPLALRAAGQPTVVYGSLLAVNGLVIVAFEAALATRLRRRRAMVVIAGGFALVGAGYLGFAGPLRGVGGLILAFSAMAVITAGEMLYKPTATAHAADAAPAGLAGRYQSLYGATSVSGMIFSPALGGWAYAHTPALIWPAAGSLALVAAVVLTRVARVATTSQLVVHSSM